MKLRKKKAFTLTELLVVVVVIGVLSAVVLPKFNKVMETRKTTEAEEMMAAIRTEQVRRCTLDKRYHGEMKEMSDLIPETTTKYYAYNLTNTGIEAKTTSNNKYSYTLVMPSYEDGRIACDGSDCSKLNKNYPSKDELLNQTADYQSVPADCRALIDCTGNGSQSCGWDGSGTQTRECDRTTSTWGAWSDCPVPPCDPGAKPTMSRPCGCKNEGTQTRVSEPVCDPSTHTWSNPSWGACSDTRTGEECCGTPTTTQACGCKNQGTKNRSKECNISTGVWSYGSWSECSISNTCPCEGDACCQGHGSKPEAERNYYYNGSQVGGCKESRPVWCDQNTKTWKTGEWHHGCSRWFEKKTLTIDSTTPCAAWKECSWYQANGYPHLTRHHQCGDPSYQFYCTIGCSNSNKNVTGLRCVLFGE